MIIKAKANVCKSVLTSIALLLISCSYCDDWTDTLVAGVENLSEVEISISVKNCDRNNENCYQATDTILSQEIKRIPLKVFDRSGSGGGKCTKDRITLAESDFDQQTIQSFVVCESKQGNSFSYQVFNSSEACPEGTEQILEGFEEETADTETETATETTLDTAP